MSARLLILAALLLAGCVTPPESEAPASAQPGETQAEPPQAIARVEPSIVPPHAPARNDDVDRLLSYFEHSRKLPGGEIARESDSARNAFNRTRSDFDRARYAMLLSVPNTPVNDDARALELLEPLVKNPGSNLHGLALLVAAHVQERRRLESGMQNLQQNVQGLQQKLDALMSLERSLINREQPPPPRKR